MAFTIVGRDVAFDPATQSVWYDTDLAILAAAHNGEGVVSGCGVAAQGSPDMTVAVAAGVIRIASGLLATVASGNATIGAASGTNPRIDLISASNAGVKTVTAGTAAASPKPPPLPAGHIALAMVLIPTSDTTIEADHLTDKRCILGGFYTGAAWGQGTAFPGSPVAGQRFTRTDQGLDYYYDGTRWVTANLFRAGFFAVDALLGSGFTTDTTVGMAPIWAATGIWLDALHVSYRAGATNTGAVYWTYKVRYRDSAGTGTEIVSANTSADAINTWFAKSSSIAAVLNSNARVLDVQALKTGSPTPLPIAFELTYRLIGT